VLCYGQGLKIADYHKPLIEATGKELLEEKAEALEVCEH
jgi:GTP:adenosylcobinamide-phosphate guanylyltransferase